jgi:hypothetical protein
MANRDLLKEAIADAKAVKETAIANAKAALEEAFTPLMQEKFAMKIAEMDKEESEEAYKMEEGEKEEVQKTYEVEEAEAESTDSMEEGELNLEELLRELGELEEDQTINGTDSETGNEDHGNIVSVNEAEEEEEEEEIDIENMDENDLKSFIESVIADMVAAGELEGNIEGGEEEEEESEEEVEINERKKYGGNKGNVPASKRGDKEDTAEEEGVEDYKKKKMKENYGGKDQLNEVDIVAAMAVASGIITAIFSMGFLKANVDQKKAIEAEAKELVKNGETPEDAVEMATKSVLEKDSKAYGTGTKAAGNAGSAFAESEMEEMKSELAEAYKTIQTIQTELQEVNLFNAKLLYTNKIFKSKNLTESQKVKVLAAFDKAASVKEAKLVFETLSEGMKEKKSPVNESMLRGSASKPAGIVAKKPILEVNDQFARWQTLAGIKK